MRQKAALDRGPGAVRDEAPQKQRAQRQFCAEIRHAHCFGWQERRLHKGVHHE